MPRYKVTMFIPQEREIEARDLQDAHNFVSKMMEAQVHEGPKPSVHSIEEIPEVEDLDLDP